MTAEEVRTPAPILESLHAAPRAARRARAAPPAPRPSTIVQRRPIRPGGARPFDSLPTKLARGSTLYQQLQMEARQRPRAEPPRPARPGLLLPSSPTWGFTPDPPKAPPRRPAPRTATILARMGGASEVYREAQLRHVAARKAAPRAARNEPDAADAYDPRGIDV
ncbi:hypothetical protein JL720_1605 [Aureococcus anophagefferens]|nr:hypothetical protein JL720_1605 [Aureococcus anophagefferens]